MSVLFIFGGLTRDGVVKPGPWEEGEGGVWAMTAVRRADLGTDAMEMSFCSQPAMAACLPG